MPNTLLIVSDMQFNSAASNTRTPVKAAIDEWVKAGFEAPRIVYWNVMGYAGSPDTKFGQGVGLVSGFSPAILQAVFGAQDFTPLAIMVKALEKYDVVVPA